MVQNHKHPRCGDFIKAALGGDLAHAGLHLREILAIAQKLQSRYFAQGYHPLGLSKALSSHLGLIAGDVRPPASAAHDDELRECQEIMRQAGLF